MIPRLAAWLLAGVAPLACAALPPLPTGIVDPALGASVSGISSGGYMAVQLHFAHAETFTQGAGVVAGGPLGCAEGDVAKALGRCMAHEQAIPVDTLVQRARSAAQRGELAPVTQVGAGRVYLFGGTRDETVRPGVMDDLRAFYRAFVPADRLRERRDVPAGHSFVTEDFGPACAADSPHFMNDCDVDLAGELLGQLAAGGQPRLPRPRVDGMPAAQAFDQRAFVTGHGLAAEGRLFVPADCSRERPCGLHVALHGCRQSVGAIGSDFVDHAGFNRWAASNRLVVLYPQTEPASANNPRGCWDWWGHDDARYATRQGPQVRAVMAMVHRLQGAPADAPVAACTTASNWTHYWADRATTDGFGGVRAVGSGESLGWWWQTSTLREWPAGQFRRGSCD